MAIQNENKLNDVPINGDKLKGEIMADLGGAKVITLLGEKIEGFDFKEMYEAFAKLFGIVYTFEDARATVMNDPHPLTYLRVNVTLAQYDKFQETFGITEGDGMYIDPSKRITIW